MNIILNTQVAIIKTFDALGSVAESIGRNTEVLLEWSFRVSKPIWKWL